MNRASPHASQSNDLTVDDAHIIDCQSMMCASSTVRSFDCEACGLARFMQLPSVGCAVTLPCPAADGQVPLLSMIFALVIGLWVIAVRVVVQAQRGADGVTRQQAQRPGDDRA